MQERGHWTPIEDELIQKFMAYNRSAHPENTLKWDEVAEKLNSKTGLKRRGKQCRDRWNNQLNPKIKKQRLSEEEMDKIFLMQDKFSKKWSQIARNLPGRTDNQIKNFFYSSLRKGIRQINTYIKYFKTKNLKKIEYEGLIKKIMSINDEKECQKIFIRKDEVYDLAKYIKNSLIVLSKDQEGVVTLNDEQILLRQKTLLKIKQFGKNCKRKKFKKTQMESEEQDVIKVQPCEDQSKKLSKQSQVFEKNNKFLKGKRTTSMITNTSEDQLNIQIQKLLENELENFEKEIKNEKNTFTLSSNLSKEPQFHPQQEDPFRIQSFFEKNEVRQIREVQSQRKSLTLKNHLLDDPEFQSLNYDSLLKNNAQVLFNSDWNEKNIKFFGDNEINLKISKQIGSCEYFKGNIDVSSSFDFFRFNKDGPKDLS